jgi:hypothetical protein
MNEEIVVGMGLDASKFGFGVRQAKGFINDFKNDIGGVGELLKRGMEGLGIILAGRELIEYGKHVIEFAAHISDFARDIGVSATFLQQFNFAAEHTGATSDDSEKALAKFAEKIGQVREGSDEASEAFKKWGIEVNKADGRLKSIEQITEEAGKKISAIEDPALRDAAAFELFGKSGYKLVDALSQIEKFKEESKGKVISDGDLAALKSAEERSKNLGERLKVISATVMAGLFTSFGIADVNAPLNAAIKRRRDEDAKSTPVVDATKAKALAEAINSLEVARNAERVKGLDHQLKLAELRTQEFFTLQHIDTLQDGSIEKIKAQTELVKLQGDIAQEKANVEKQWLDDKNKKLQEANEHKAHEAALQYEINQAGQENFDSQDKLNQVKGERSQLTVKELDESKLTFGGELGEDQRNAKKIAMLERQGEWNRTHGFLSDAKDRFDSADELRKSLSSNVVEKDRLPFKSMEESAKKTESHLQELLRKANAEGIKIVPQLSQ